MSVSPFALILLSAIKVIWVTGFQESFDMPEAYPSIVVFDKIYYISKVKFVSYTEASKWCSENGGGYPAEIDTAEELAVIEQYAYSTNLRRIFIAGTDAKKDGIFLSQRTGVFIHIFNWVNGEPNNNGRVEDCLELNGSREGRVNDTPCNRASISHNVLCELDLRMLK
ncbi:collectin-11 [Biomphalaria pfeifferi]|uniref:Collectin-11 n=1 Tax=Biomphalaria pfeifferi TaxID=112525 RepID=A0AAD8C304_BIOPF|nr:collectin-11 [Biomphalaria pfeifferi]